MTSQTSPFAPGSLGSASPTSKEPSASAEAAVASPAASGPAISARNLTLTLGSAAAPVDILKGIDLDIAAGEVVALIGPSGSGKSSLMAVLSGLERASGGDLTVAGEDFTDL
ncbi:MAG: ATP-binding cassette domain-containing protein, partial [Pseudomonadota bacterium]